MSLELLLAGLAIWAVPVLLAVAGHEVAHGWAARRLGDDTAARLGRLSMNPLRHVDPVGTVLVPLGLKLAGSPYLFGWARPVPVDWSRLRRPRRDMALVALAGPGANLVMLGAWVALGMLLSAVAAAPGGGLPGAMVRAGIVINSILIVVNLVPIPPLDGSRVVSALLPPAAAAQYGRFEHLGLVLVLVLLLTGVLGAVLGPVLRVVIGLSLGALA